MEKEEKNEECNEREQKEGFAIYKWLLQSILTKETTPPRGGW